MLNQQPFGTMCNNVSANFTFSVQPNLRPFFVLPSQIRWTRGCRWLKSLVGFKFQISTKKYKKVNHYFVIKNPNPIKSSNNVGIAKHKITQSDITPTNFNCF
jgi:hypothetical protein